ncbi:MAG TPA: hypothetical protein VKB93_08365 [Thermoanaerobaculia bacterium]|nr:hypothetical protein [Thermoanaerobaculia bacterium]
MNIDYATLEDDVFNGTFRQKLQDEVTAQFHQLHDTGERLPPASYTATKIAEIVNREAALSENTKYELYQEILAAVEHARAEVLGGAAGFSPPNIKPAG